MEPEIGKWYWVNDRGLGVLFFRCDEIMQSTTGNTYKSKLFISRKKGNSITNSLINVVVLHERHTPYLVPISTTEVLNYFLDGRLPEIF